uniref:Uncharacterized protein n=1 Tax=Arundo donax TaxID=35708 RepID=A0A0A9B642_ARUDO
MQIFGLSITTARFTYLRNHNQLSVLSCSANIKAIGTT